MDGLKLQDTSIYWLKNEGLEAYKKCDQKNSIPLITLYRHRSIRAKKD
jgi:hypothetical protein